MDKGSELIDESRPLRRALLAVLTLGVAGSLTELLLLGHTEDRFQWIPVIGLGVGLVSVGSVSIIPGRTTLRMLCAVMLGFILAGFLGINRHYTGNVEFELEMYPSRQGFELFREAMAGATPALAPGTMVLLGLVGLTFCLRHPILRNLRSPAPRTNSKRNRS